MTLLQQVNYNQHIGVTKRTKSASCMFILTAKNVTMYAINKLFTVWVFKKSTFLILKHYGYCI